MPEDKKYRVTWKAYKDPQAGFPGHDDMTVEDHEQIFDDIDQGYSYYENLKKGRSRAFDATWEHVTVREDA